MILYFSQTTTTDEQKSNQRRTFKNIEDRSLKLDGRGAPCKKGEGENDSV